MDTTDAHTPAFAFPAKFAKITGLSAKEVRRLCLQKVLPNEKTRKGFRIDVEAGLIVLHERAAGFVGHDWRYNQRDIPSSPQYKKKQKTKVADGFITALNALKGGNDHGRN